MEGSKYSLDNIGPEEFDDILSQYSSVVPQKLAELEKQRLIILPAEIAKRKRDGKAYLTKQEVATLVDWKLSHGTFRPSLKALVQQNSEEFVIETTTAGLSDSVLESALTTLTKLKGIGPATASLLLSTSSPAEVPFFSDELFRWAFWEDKAGCRWDRKINYSAKEYRELAAKVTGFVNQFAKDVSVIEVEKVAYVVGKRAIDLASHNVWEQKPGIKRSANEVDSTTNAITAKNSKTSPLPPKRKAKTSAINENISTRITRSSTRLAKG